MNELLQLFMNLNFSSFGWKLALPLILIASDIITGLIQSLINNDYKSSIMRQGLFHKVLELLILFLGFMFQFAFKSDVISTSIVIYLCVMELGSILENLKKSGMKLGLLSKILTLINGNKSDDTTKAIEKTIENVNDKNDKNDASK